MTKYDLRMTIVLRVVKFVILTSYIVTIISCANVVAPSGGEKDTTPPQLLNANPPNKSIHFSLNRITLDFDEYIKLNNINAQSYLYPSADGDLEFNLKGKALEISLDKVVLNPNTTYTLYFGNGIQDNNEGNTLKDFSYVFSTGSFIDSLSLSGSCVVAETNESTDEAIIGLYLSGNDSTFYKIKPYYYVRANKSGQFRFDNLAPGHYNLYALKDQNNNLYFDLPNESIAFLNDAIEISADTNLSINLSLFDEESSIKLLEAKSDRIGEVKFTFSKAILNPTIKEINVAGRKPLDLFEYGMTNDTVVYWTSDVFEKEKFFEVYDGSNFIDSAEVSMKYLGDTQSIKDIDTLIIFTKNANYIELGKELNINFNRPVAGSMLNQILVLEDTTQNIIEPKYVFKNDLLKTSLNILYSWKEGMKYEIIIPKQTFTDILGLQNDTTIFELVCKKQENYGTLFVEFKIDSLNDKPYYIQLFDAKDKIVREEYIPNTKKLTYKLLDPGNYDLKIIEDLNENKKWDTGIFSEKKQPEKIISYKGEISMRADWDTEISVEVK